MKKKHGQDACLVSTLILIQAVHSANSHFLEPRQEMVKAGIAFTSNQLYCSVFVVNPLSLPCEEGES